MTGLQPRRRILLVLNDFGWAGAEKQLYHLAKGLRASGHQVTLLAIGGGMIEIGPLREAGVQTVALGAASRVGKVRRVGAIRRHARQADVVHCTGFDATLWGRLGGLLARRPTLFTEHTPGRRLQTTVSGGSRERLIALHNRALDRWTYAAIVVGAWQEQLLVEEGVRPESIVHIPNAVPIDELRKEAERGPSREELGIANGARVVVHVARFTPQKGQTTTLRAVSRLREQRGEDIRALFVGEGPEEARVRQEADGLGAGWASFLGRRDDVPGLLRLADLCVLPSRGEGLPMALIESEAIGTPVVATDVGDIRWLLESTGGGICVAGEDEAGFVEACGRVLGDEGLRGRLSEAAVRGAREGFDAPRMVRRYEEVFEAAIGSAPLPLTLSA